MSFKYGSVCSGVEAATCAWHPLGWEPQWFSEIEAFPCKVLKHHYPDVPNIGDMMHLNKNKIYNESIIDLLVGGTPCQSFSLAGLRAGLDSANGNLALQYCRILIEKRPKWFVWENVPGVFSSFSDGSGVDHGIGDRWTETSDFATILSAFSQCGYSLSWRVFDSRYFGVAQRRRRVFVVGHLGDDWRPSFSVLFEPSSLRGGPAPSRKERESIAGTITASAARSRGAGTDPGALTGINISFNDVNGQRKDRPKGGLYVNETDVANCVTAEGGTDTLAVAKTLTTSQSRIGVDDNFVVMSSSQTNASVTENQSCTLTALNETPIVSGKWPADTASTLNAHFGEKQGLEDQHINSGAPLFVPHNVPGDNDVMVLNDQGGDRMAVEKTEISPTLRSESHQHEPIVKTRTLIRRLTPLECERLQGFPDNYTKIKGAKDGPRYKAIGNSMTVDVMRWIGKRIQLVDSVLSELAPR